VAILAKGKSVKLKRSSPRRKKITGGVKLSKGVARFTLTVLRGDGALRLGKGGRGEKKDKGEPHIVEGQRKKAKSNPWNGRIV